MPNPYEIAARRFELIAFLIDPSLDAAQRRAAWRDRSAEVGRSTLYRWLAPEEARRHRAWSPRPTGSGHEPPPLAGILRGAGLHGAPEPVQ